MTSIDPSSMTMEHCSWCWQHSRNTEQQGSQLESSSWSNCRTEESTLLPRTRCVCMGYSKTPLVTSKDHMPHCWPYILDWDTSSIPIHLDSWPSQSLSCCSSPDSWRNWGVEAIQPCHHATCNCTDCCTHNTCYSRQAICAATEASANCSHDPCKAVCHTKPR